MPEWSKRQTQIRFCPQPEKHDFVGLDALEPRAELPQALPAVPGRSGDLMTGEVLGEPLTIREVARLLGCSVWTVRQRYLPSGLPHFRIGSTGKFVFYRNQIIRWILEKQKQKGGVIR